MKKSILVAMVAMVMAGVVGLATTEFTYADNNSSGAAGGGTTGGGTTGGGAAGSGKTCPAGSLRAGEGVTSLAECNLSKDEADESTLMKTIQTIINVALGILGIVTVAAIIIGGFQYVTSTGDAGKVTKAKNTIMYGVIGLVVALLAWAIVNFVLSNVFNGGSGGGGGSSTSSGGSSSSTSGGSSSSTSGGSGSSTGGGTSGSSGGATVTTN